MTMTETFPGPLPAGRWLSAAALAGAAWNIFGIVQFAGAVRATPESLMASGLSAEQAAVMTGYPAWMTAAFAIGVFGGTLGSALLFVRHRLAVPVLALSLLAYVALWTGDLIHGVFAAMGAPQVLILTAVVAIAAGLLWLAVRAPAPAL